MTKEEYNAEPVFYCTNCLSLHVKELGQVELTVCQDCGNTSISETSIDSWNHLYVEEYGEMFLYKDLDSIEE